MNETEEKRDEATEPEEPACGIPEEAPAEEAAQEVEPTEAPALPTQEPMPEPTEAPPAETALPTQPPAQAPTEAPQPPTEEPTSVPEAETPSPAILLHVVRKADYSAWRESEPPIHEKAALILRLMPIRNLVSNPDPKQEDRLATPRQLAIALQWGQALIIMQKEAPRGTP